MQRFANTSALITGGSRGIGAAVARRLAAEGASVTITYRINAGRAQSLVTELTSAGHTAFAFQGDVRDRAATQAVARRATELAARNITINAIAPGGTQADGAWM
jgi:3-oxoacyl-[acyl-carrier protein] reductase